VFSPMALSFLHVPIASYLYCVARSIRRQIAHTCTTTRKKCDTKQRRVELPIFQYTAVSFCCGYYSVVLEKYLTMFHLSVVVLLPLVIAREAGLPLRLTSKDLALAPISIQHRNNLQGKCEQTAEDIVSQRYASISGVKHSCSCDTSSATCDSVFPETCASVDCSLPQVEGIESGATSVQVCFRDLLRIYRTRHCPRIESRCHNSFHSRRG
jgi:hypothetical protein